MRQLIFVVVLLFAARQGCAQSLDAVTNGDTTNANPSTVSVTIAANSDRVLFAFHTMMGTTSSCTTSTVDLDATAATKIGEVGTSSNAIADDAYASMWRIIAPATGAHTLNANISSCGFDGYSRVIVYSFYNVDQGNPNGTCTTVEASTGTTSSINVTSVSGNIVFDGLGAVGNPTTTAGGTQTDRSTGLDRVDASTLTATTTLTGMSWSISGGSFGHAQIGCAVNAVSGGGGGGGGTFFYISAGRRRR